MNEFTTVDWNSYTNSKYFVIQNIKILGRYFSDFKACLVYDISVQCIEYAYQEVQ